MKPSDYKRRIAVTGGAGFIGANFLNMMVPKYPDYLFVNIDCLTYAANLSSLRPVADRENYRFEKISICDMAKLAECFERYEINAVIHLAAESHVDRSIVGPAEFINTNIIGTYNLLELARARTQQKKEFRFHHVSTDEVYGSLGAAGFFTERSPLCPNSPYSASKAAGDHLVRAYHNTYGLNTVTTRCSNNYGPYQFPEKLIPLMIRNAKAVLPLPVYGDGRQVRDWLYVEDHCRALNLAFHEGRPGSVYNVGGHNEIENVELVRKVCRLMDGFLGGRKREDLITFVKDRPGHDRRYAIDASLIEKELGWKPQRSLDEGLETTVGWYNENEDWLAGCISGKYLEYYREMYADR